MSRLAKSAALFALAAMLGSTLPACSPAGSRKHVKLGPPERFDWVPQPIEFSPPPTQWRQRR